MNAVEIEEAISKLAEQPFDAGEFAYEFLRAFGEKETTLKRLRKGDTNKTDLGDSLPGAVLWRDKIHIAVAPSGRVSETLTALKASPATARWKARFVLATDGTWFEAEDLTSEAAPVACDYRSFPDHFGLFLPLAGISTVRQIAENAFDIRATSRLNRLYVTLRRENPDWDTAARRPDMNHFMARLIFFFFAEDTDIFRGSRLFTATLEQMSARDGSDTDFVIGEIFRAMNIPPAGRAAADLRPWADAFPYVNGGLFSGSPEVPRFTREARSYLLNIGSLDWRQINPDIFGSMIQAVADDEERGALGMHYTSVPNILKVLNPLFLDDLRGKLADAGDNPRKLLNLRTRMARIRVFDPACGSGNFLVIAYKQMREIEAEINRRRGEADLKSAIPLTNFRGIELRDFPAEIARLALIIAEYQCDVLYRGEKLALATFLPLNAENWIVCGNALRLDWQTVCPPFDTAVKYAANDLLHTPTDQAEVDFENEGGEVYICGNPPYKGSQTQNKEQKIDLDGVFSVYGVSSKQIDYVGGWFLKAAEYAKYSAANIAFVSTNSICQGRIVPILWPKIFEFGSHIHFAHTSFKWANLASHNAGVTVVIVGISQKNPEKRYIFDNNEFGEAIVRETSNITPYLTTGESVIVKGQNNNLSEFPEMSFGNMPIDGGNLLISSDEVSDLRLSENDKNLFVRRIYGSAEFIRGIVRYCIWIPDEILNRANEIEAIKLRINKVRNERLGSKDAGTRGMAIRPHQFREMYAGMKHTIVLAGVSSESRHYLPVGLLDNRSVVSNLAFALYDAPLWNMALIASRLHLVWIATVCGKLKTDFRYSNTLGWNTFPVPTLTAQDKADLTRCAEDILLAREAYFPATIADMYDPARMDAEFPLVRAAHERNDELLERIYIGRRFRNDTERLEKLFDLYTKMTAAPAKPAASAKSRKART